MKPVTFLVVLLGLSACDPQVESRKVGLPVQQAAPASYAPLTPTGPATVTIAPAQ
jgi:hypothetical protein